MWFSARPTGRPRRRWISLQYNGGNGFTLFGVDVNDFMGYGVSGAGDVNGDGFDDLLIGAESGDAAANAKPNAGESYVVFGKADWSLTPTLELATLNGTNGFTLFGIDIGDESGFAVSGAGDVNGDGFGDLLIGAQAAAAAGNAKFLAGESYVVFGKTDWSASPTLDLATLNGTNGFTLFGIDVGDESGFAVSGGGDVNGDGFDDLLIGTAEVEKSHVVFAGSYGAPPRSPNLFDTTRRLLVPAFNGVGADIQIVLKVSRTPERSACMPRQHWDRSALPSRSRMLAHPETGRSVWTWTTLQESRRSRSTSS